MGCLVNVLSSKRPRIFASTLTIIILTIYFLANMPAMKAVLYRAVPRTRRARVGLLGDEILDRVGGYVLGNLATSVIAGVASLSGSSLGESLIQSRWRCSSRSPTSSR